MAQVLAEVGPRGEPRRSSAAYPHQLSGGQQQRIALAMAFACRPQLIVLDEPTTGLDVATQRHVLDTVRGLCSSYGVAAVYVTHDLAVVAEIADRVAVMYAGRLIELGTTKAVFGAPAHPYTEGLLQAIPSPERRQVLVGMKGQPPRPGQAPAAAARSEPRCSYAVPACAAGAPARDAGQRGSAPLPLLPGARGRAAVGWRAARRPTSRSPIIRRPRPRSLLEVRGLVGRYGAKEMLHGVALTVPRGGCVAVVGESGSGKTTLARCLVGLHADWSGAVAFEGKQVGPRARDRDLEVLRAVQYVFQSPYTSLNPRKTIGQLVEQPLAHFFKLSGRERSARVVAALESAALSAEFLSRYPDQLSGGERQRVAIARALVVEPRLLVCDEVTSALDVSVQAAIVELLSRLQAERDLSLLFITHNLALVRSIAQEVVVLHEGSIVERGPTDAVLSHPADDYTIRLLEDVPKLTSLAEAAPVDCATGALSG